jgi:hypothetical protein
MESGKLVVHYDGTVRDNSDNSVVQVLWSVIVE